MKIAQVNLQRDYGGAEIHVRMLARGLQERGHEARVFCHPQGRLRQEMESDGPRLEPLLVRSQLAPSAVLRLAARLRRDRPDILHLHTPKDYLTGVVAGRLAQVPGIVLTRHMLLPLKPLMRRVYANVDAVICLSQGLQSLLQSQGVPSDKLHLIYGAIDAAPFAGDFAGEKEAAETLTLRKAWQADEGADALLVGCVGRLVAGKGQDTLLEAIAQCRLRQARVMLILIGDGPQRVSLEAQADRLGITDRVRFVGFRKDIPQVLHALDVVVTPSTGVELLPLAVMEAMASLRPVIASRIGGVPEIIADDSLGLLAPPGDVSALTDALCRLANNATLRQKLGAAGAARIQAQFALPRLLDETEQLYARLLR